MALEMSFVLANLLFNKNTSLLTGARGVEFGGEGVQADLLYMLKIALCLV